MDIEDIIINYECDMEREKLKESNYKNIRSCSICNKNVYYCKCIDELKLPHSKENHCAYINISKSHMHRDSMIGDIRPSDSPTYPSGIRVIVYVYENSRFELSCKQRCNETRKEILKIYSDFIKERSDLIQIIKQNNLHPFLITKIHCKFLNESNSIEFINSQNLNLLDEILYLKKIIKSLN